MSSSAASQEYLVTLRNLISSEQPATAAALARRLHVSPQAASEMIHRLQADGLVDHAEGRQLTLTRRGRSQADATFRRHALMEWLLTSVIGMGWAESDQEAHRLQASISEALGRQLDTNFSAIPRPARMATRSMRQPPGAGRLASRSARSPRARRRPSTALPKRPRRTRRSCRISRPAASSPERRSWSAPAVTWWTPSPSMGRAAPRRWGSARRPSCSPFRARPTPRCSN